MATTTAKQVSNQWTQVAANNCTVQAKTGGMFNVFIGATAPTDSDAHLDIVLNTATTLAFGDAVWLKQHTKTTATVVVVE